MGFSLHIPLPGGVLKIKSSDRLRYEERFGDFGIWKLGSICLVWWPNSRKSG